MHFIIQQSSNGISINEHSIVLNRAIEKMNIIVEQFIKQGVPAVHIDKDSSDEERDQAIEDLRTGKIKVI